MSEPLQALGYRDSPYLRPNQNWVCGHASQGCPCEIGPDKGGHCRSGYECDPVRVGDRWNCTRSQLSGGPCADGPLADGTCCRQIPLCRPVRSWRGRRGAVMRWLLAVVAGLLILVLAGGYRTAFINPGELSFQHAELTDCGSCHAAFHEGVRGWLRAAWSDNIVMDESKPCMACHKMAGRGQLVHSLPAESLQALSMNVAPATAGGRSVGVQLANLAFGKPAINSEALPCMTCHSEHKGAESNLASLSDDRCNTCHQVQFHSLASGHPDFARYPYERRTPLQFDHTSHIDKHFRDAKMAKMAPGECRDCHKTDKNGRLMELKSFETSCGACHGEQVAGAGRASAKGMAIFAVPGLDVAGLRDQGAAIGEWPEFADGTVPPLMNLLLSADPGYGAANAVFKAIDDPMDLSEANAEQLAAVETLAWSVKSLLFDLRTKGVAALHARLQGILGRPLSAAEKAALTALLPVDAIAAAQKEWFPALAVEIPRQRAGEVVLMPSDKAPDAAREDNGAGETSDKKDADGDAEIDTGKKDADDEISTGKDGDDKEIATGKDDEIDTGKKDDDDEISTGKDDDEIATGKDDDEIATGKVDDEMKDATDSADRALAPVIAVATGEDWNVSGGWYRDDFVLRYRPTGHADAFIRAWLDLTGKAGLRREESGQVFETLIDAKAPGLCGKCHSVDEQADGGLLINWRAYHPADGLKKSVRFSHAAHFSLLDERGCLTCHARDDKADYAAAFKDRNPATFAANFKPLPRAVCAECHTAAKAGNKCLTCHNYHLGVFLPVAAHTEGMLKEVSNKR
ncbi:MAG: hypothetical protein O2967_08515 [Proteobacteria bacterium]|nr:hypothetical protein [Pseudomonadota bacterium]